MSYSRGVLIHNFNEDRFGQDLQRIPRPPDAIKASVTSLVHHWKQPEPQDSLEPKGVDRHILFGHAGDMRDPHTTLQRAEFATANQYFLQDPAKVPRVGHLTAENFAVSDDPVHVSHAHPGSTLATKAKEAWGDMRQSHTPTVDDRFLTSSRAAHTGQQGEPFPRLNRHYNEFTAGHDAVTLSRSARQTKFNQLRSTGQQLVAQ